MKLRITIGLLILLLLAWGCGAPAPEVFVEEAVEAPPVEEPAAEEPALEEPAAEPAEDLGLVIYGPDSRYEAYAHPDITLQEMAASVAILTQAASLEIREDQVEVRGPRLKEWIAQRYAAPLCSEEIYAEQTIGGICTGFLVAEDLLITAGHCFRELPCSDARFVFGFQMAGEGSPAALSAGEVYGCKEIVAMQNDEALDYAVVRLDRPNHLPALQIQEFEQIRGGDPLAVIGHPTGLPLKIASDAYVTDEGGEEAYFVANLDTFAGNSGSPVINTATYEVLGLLVRGETDYVPAEGGACYQANECALSGEGCRGEAVLKTASFAEQIPSSGTAAGSEPSESGGEDSGAEVKAGEPTGDPLAALPCSGFALTLLLALCFKFL